MKNSADLGECYPPRPPASVDNILLDLQNSLYHTDSINNKLVASKFFSPRSLHASEQSSVG